MENGKAQNSGQPTGRLRISSRLMICVLIIGIALTGAVYLQKTKPRAKKKPPVKVLPLVTIRKVFPDRRRMKVRAMGTVVPAREILLKSRVAGEVVHVHPEFMEGGYIPQGEVLIRIDPTDYRLQIAKSASMVVAAEYALKLEMGHQEVARREWEVIQKEQPMRLESQDLALRKPHLEKAEADLAAARADLAQAELNLERTTIRSPHHAIVRTKMVDVGSQVSVQGSLAELISVDEYRIQVSIPVGKLQYIDFPEKPSETGPAVRVVYRDDYAKTGEVIQLLGDLEMEGRMARVIVSVPDPLGKADEKSGQPPLLIGEYVRVEIQGPELAQVYRIPETAFRDNRYVWVVDDQNRLDIRKATAMWREGSFVFIRGGLSAGDQLVVSDIPVPVSGMPVKVQPE